jgi:ketosteroid isomerase-like protein
MSKLFRFAVIASAVFAVSCGQQIDLEGQRAAIHKFHDECSKALLTGNVECFAENGQWLPPKAPPITGRDKIGELVSQAIEDPNFSVSHEIVDIDVSDSGDLAYIHYTYKFTSSGPDGNPITEQGKAIYVLKKQPQAGWKILFDIWNTDRPEICAAEGDEADIAAIHDLFKRYDSSATAGQFKEWMSLFSDDIIWTRQDQPALAGKDAVWGDVEPLFTDLDNEHVSTLDEISVAGDMAFVRTTYTWRFTPKAGGKTDELNGMEEFVLSRQTDNSWLISRVIWSKVF